KSNTYQKYFKKYTFAFKIFTFHLDTMDFSKFSDDDFDLKDWINNALRSQVDTNQSKEQFVGTLVTKLQVLIQEINNSIDETSHQTIQNFPRVLREIDVLKQEAFMLKEQMKSVREDLLKVEKNTVSDSMKLLLELDIVRTNLLNVQIALQEADNWSNLTSDLDSVLASKDSKKISNHIESMQNSLELLQDDSMDFTNRCTLLEDFKNRFETMISTDLVSCFNSKSITLSKNYVQIFSQINRLDNLKKYYYQCEVARNSAKIAELEANIGNSFKGSKVVFDVEEFDSNDFVEKSDNLKIFLSSWLDYLVTTWHNEIQWCKQIFNDSHSIVINTLNRSIEDFNKIYHTHLENMLNSCKDYGILLEYLEKYKQETDRFVQTLYSSAENMALLSQSLLNDLLFKFFKQTYSPYKKLFKQYSSIVTKNLQKEFEANIKLNSYDVIECVQLLSGSVNKIFNLIEKEIERCLKLTNGCCFYMMIDAFKVFLRNYLDEFKRVVTNLKERRREQTKTDDEDWDSFRHFVKIIQIIGELIVRYEDLEESLDRNLLNNFVHKTRHGSVTTPTTPQQFHFDQQAILLNQNLQSMANFKEYILDENDRLKLNGLIAAVESGDDYSMMKDLLRPLFSLSEIVHKFAFEIVYAPIKLILKKLSKSSIWQANESGLLNKETIPLFAMAPQDYITKIGQYLLTLPQNFEPFTMHDNNNLLIALRKGKLPYLDEKDLSDDITACWLDSIANATYANLSDEILKIGKVSINAQRQLIIDIEYINSVFDDVGLKDYSNLTSIIELLKANEEEFDEITGSKPVRVASAIRKMRDF
ncbi:conserved oligomeric Golgi complex subunit 7-like, partial [Brachionus plicatilis]